jgi:hypothetical protein
LQEFHGVGEKFSTAIYLGPSVQLEKNLGKTQKYSENDSKVY